MQNKFIRNQLRVIYLSVFIVIIDQVTKLLVKGIRIPLLGIDIIGMAYGSSNSVFGNFVRITFIENPGMAFGLDIGPKMFLTIFTIIASLVILYYIFKHRNDDLLLRIALGFILAGAVGNLLDRTFYGYIYNYAPLFYGKVVDFIQVDIWDFTIFGRTFTTWPIFNVADVSVTIGFFIILFFNKKIFKHENDEQNVILDNNAEDLQKIVKDDINQKNDYEKIDNSIIDNKPLFFSGSINNNNNNSIENSEKLKDTGTPGTEEDKD